MQGTLFYAIIPWSLPKWTKVWIWMLLTPSWIEYPVFKPCQSNINHHNGHSNKFCKPVISKIVGWGIPSLLPSFINGVPVRSSVIIHGLKTWVWWWHACRLPQNDLLKIIFKTPQNMWPPPPSTYPSLVGSDFKLIRCPSPTQRPATLVCYTISEGYPFIVAVTYTDPIT